MREIQYKDFSLKAHKKNWRIKRPNVCQFELTFGCDLRCKHCYTDCYNRDEYKKGELNTAQVKHILDKVYNAGAIWLCFTGGDPLTREDFLEIYSYAKDKGFIVTIFTNGYSMTGEIVEYLEKRPPFVIEITLNGATKETYEKITNVQGSFEKTMNGLGMILDRKIPLKIKTQVTKDNLKELPEIKMFIEKLGVKFQPSAILHARLDGNPAPVNLRISPQEFLSLNGKIKTECLNEINKHNEHSDFLFSCAIGGGDGINIDPHGNMHPCSCIREPLVNLLTSSIEQGVSKLLPLVRGRRFTTDSKCHDCKIRELCRNCPGKALLEAGEMEAPLEYFCELAEAMLKKKG